MGAAVINKKENFSLHSNFQSHGFIDFLQPLPKKFAGDATHTARSHPQNIADTSHCDIEMFSRTSQERFGDVELSQPSDVAMLLLA